MSKTSIEWCDEVLNPARGCTAVSPGCLNCYAARHATRFSKPGLAFAGLAHLKDQPRDASGRKRPKLAVWSGEVTLIPKALHEPLHWSPKHPKRVFVGSVTDMFHAQVPFEYIAALFAVMAATPWVTYQLVTKRPERMAEWFRWTAEMGPWKAMLAGALEYLQEAPSHPSLSTDAPWPLPNVHLLTSTENQETFDARVPHLLACPAVVHGVSAEPLLGPIDMGLGGWVRTGPWPDGAFIVVRTDRPRSFRVDPDFRPEPTPLALRWVIAGGESGPGARLCDAEWIRDLRRQCVAANTVTACADGRHTAFFPKQLGALAYDERNYIAGARLPLGPDTPAPVRRLKDAHGGDETEWAPDLQGLRAFPIPAPLSPDQRRHLGIT